MATMFNKVDCVKLLLEHPDIDVNAKDYHVGCFLSSFAFGFYHQDV